MRSLNLVLVVMLLYGLGLRYHPRINRCSCFGFETKDLALGFALLDSKKNRKESVSAWEQRLLIAINIASALAVPLPTNESDDNRIFVDIIEDALAESIDNDDSQVSIDIASTSGYIDPNESTKIEENPTSEVTTRSDDIYGLGVALMEIITGKPMFQRGEDNDVSYGLLTHWVSSMFAEGEVGSIVDPMLKGDFDINSVEEALKIAVACVSEYSADKPTMDQVIIKLNHCLEIERARLINKAAMSFVSLTSIQVNVNETNDSL